MTTLSSTNNGVKLDSSVDTNPTLIPDDVRIAGGNLPYTGGSLNSVNVALYGNEGDNWSIDNKGSVVSLIPYTPRMVLYYGIRFTGAINNEFDASIYGYTSGIFADGYSSVDNAGLISAPGTDFRGGHGASVEFSHEAAS